VSVTIPPPPHTTYFFLSSGLRGLTGIFLKAAVAVDKENVSTVCLHSYFSVHNEKTDTRALPCLRVDDTREVRQLTAQAEILEVWIYPFAYRAEQQAPLGSASCRHAGCMCQPVTRLVSGVSAVTVAYSLNPLKLEKLSETIFWKISSHLTENKISVINTNRLMLFSDVMTVECAKHAETMFRKEAGFNLRQVVYVVRRTRWPRGLIHELSRGKCEKSRCWSDFNVQYRLLCLC
jgi:hypothetical protein